MGAGRYAYNHSQVEHLGACVGRAIGTGLQIVNVNALFGEVLSDFMNDAGVVQGYHVNGVGYGGFVAALACMLDCCC